MNNTQDPKRHVEYLQQCLSSDKKPLGFFLGAGCPMAIKSDPDKQTPLIPGLEGITAIVREALAESSEFGSLLNAIDANFELDGRDNATVEDILTHIRALRTIAGKDQVRGLSAANLDRIDDEICRIIHQTVNIDLPNAETAYNSIATWVNAIEREFPVEVFTTNYDLLMEQAFEEAHVPYFDGFTGVRRPFFDLRAMEEDQLPPRWARLWKLHGSVNWHYIPNKGVYRSTVNDADESKRVIFPSHLKLQESRRLPYLAMIDRLRAFLKNPTSVLVICGYSFRDEHLNEAIIQALQSTRTSTAFALLFGKLENYTEAVSLAKDQSNLALLARNGGIIGKLATSWPTKDADSVIDNGNSWISWNSCDGSSDVSKVAAEFKLGDFDVFGQFLLEVAGCVRQPAEVHDVQ